MKADYTPFVVFICKLILGITFIWASYSKIADPAGFATILYGYGVFPGMTINLLAIIVPFLELVAGFSLLMRLYPRSALIIINGFLVSFIVLLSFNLARGHEFDCGCFSITGGGTQAVVSLLIRDILLLAAGIYVFRKTKPA
ncbi:MAG: protein MauE [Desulfobacterales bacterium]|nr:protein MauE [Desulfobacterales bacterium]